MAGETPCQNRKTNGGMPPYLPADPHLNWHRRTGPAILTSSARLYSETKPASAHKTTTRAPGPPWTYGYSRLQAHCHRLTAPSARIEQKSCRLPTSKVHAYRGHEVLIASGPGTHPDQLRRPVRAMGCDPND